MTNSKFSKINSNVTSSALYTVGTVIGQGMTFIGGVVFTRIMSQSDYGMYSTYYAMMAILVVFVGANLYVPLNNAYIDYKDVAQDVKKAMLTLSLLIFIGVLIVFFWLFSVFNRHYSIIFGLCMPIHAYSFFLVNYEMYSANMEGRTFHKMLLLILPNTLQFLCSIIPFLFLKNVTLEARIIGSTIGVAICGFVPLTKTLGSRGKAFVTKYWRYGLRISLPSIFSSISAMIMQQSDRVMITNLCGAEQTAVYSFIYYVGYAIEAVDQALKAVFMAWIYRAIDGDNLDNVQLIQKWYLILM